MTMKVHVFQTFKKEQPHSHKKDLVANIDNLWIAEKLDGVGPVDNRPSPD